MLARRRQEVSGCVRRRLCGFLSTLSLEHNRFYGRVRSHQHHTLGDKQSAKMGMLFDAFHSTLLGSEGIFLACFIDSDVLSTPCSWESSTSTSHVAVSIPERRHHPLASWRPSCSAKSTQDLDGATAQLRAVDVVIHSAGVGREVLVHSERTND